jgi:hypothetical protein
MRRISNKRKEAKSKKMKQLGIILVLAFVLLGSTFGFIFSMGSFDDPSSINQESIETRYNGETFISQNGFWFLNKYGANFSFISSPSETDSLVLEREEISNTINDYSNVPIYIYSENSNAELEIYKNIFPIAERVQNACPSGKECSNENWPVKDCSENLIIIEESSVNEIVQEENCVYIRGNENNLIQISDEFLFKILGVK